MSIAALIRAMSNAGAPPEAIALAVEAIEGAQAEVEAKRTVERERKRRQRERDKDGTVTGQSRDADGTVTPAAPSLDKSPQTPKINPTPPTHTGETRARKAEPFPQPEWADPTVWADLLTNRRKKNLPNTASAHRKLLADIDRLTDDNWPPGRVLEAAVSRGWGAIYAGCKDDDDGRRSDFNGRSAQRLGGPGPSKTLQMRRAAAAAVARGGDDRVGPWPALSASDRGG